MPVFIQEFIADERQGLTNNANVRVSDGRNQRRATLREVFDASRAAFIYRERVDAQQEREREAYRRRIEALAPIIGRGPNMMGGFRNPTDIWAEHIQDSRMQGGWFTVRRQKRMFADALDSLARTHKDIDPRLVASMDEDIAAVGLGASADLAEVKDRRSYQSMLKNVDTEIVAFAGGFVGSLSDPTALPQFIAGFLSGGTSLVGKNVAQQVLITGAREATSGVVMEGALQGVRKSNEEALGQEYGLKEAAGNLAGAAIGGAVIGGGGELLGAVGRKILKGRALPLNDPTVIEPTRPNQARNPSVDLPEGLARTIEGYAPDLPPARPDAPAGFGAAVQDTAPSALAPDLAPDNGTRPFGFVPPDSDRLVDWEKAFGDFEVPPDIRAALGVIEAENASVAASRATPAPYRVPDADGVRAIEKAYAALELGEPLPAPALPRRFADLPEGADASMPMHPDEALAAAAIWRATGEHPALAAGDPVLLDLIEDLGRLSNATFDQVSRGDLPEDMGAVIGALAWNRPDTHQELSAMLIDGDIGDVAIAREMVSNRLADLTPDASGALLGVRALPVLPAIDMADVTPVRLADAAKRPAPAIPRSLDDFDVMTPLESARAFAERNAQEQLREAANLAKRKPDPDMLDGEWKERVASMRAGALRDLAILDKGGLPESGYQALDDVMRARSKAVAPKRRAKPIEPGSDAAIQQGKDAAARVGMDDVARVQSALGIAQRVKVTVEAGGNQGPIIKGLEGDFKSAVTLLRKIETGQVNGALTHPDLGAINLIWGDRKSGLAHILTKHSDDLANLDVFEAAFVAAKLQPESKGNVAVLSDGTYFFDVRKDWMGQPNSWLLTGFRATNLEKQSGKITARAARENGLAGDRTITGIPTSDQALLALDRQTSENIPPTPPKINDAADSLGEDASFDLIDMIVDPDGSVGNVDNPGTMTARDAAKVAARDDFMVERFRGCIL